MNRKMTAVFSSIFGLALLPGVTMALAADEVPLVTVADAWSVKVSAGMAVIDGKKVKISAPATLAVDKPQVVVVKAEKIETPGRIDAKIRDPIWWQFGTRLKGVTTSETTAPGMLIPESFKLKAGPGADALVYEINKDYRASLEGGSFGYLEGGRIQRKQPVYADYAYELCRLDTVVVDAAGRVSLRKGDSHIYNPKVPALKAGEVALANVWILGRLEALTEDNIFPVQETKYPDRPAAGPSAIERLAPKTWKKMKAGEKVRVLAWGDSCTEAAFLKDPAQRWQAQFVERLKKRFPKANIELISEGWSGRSTQSYLEAPADSPHNYQAKVLDSKPDLILSEFVNDTGLSLEQVETRYGQILADFKKIGAEWIILSPHYLFNTRAHGPRAMGPRKERENDDIPVRTYVTGLRLFCEKHQVALGDASPRWGRLWRQGIPYQVYLMNCYNHPDERGMALYADSLMSLFP